MLARNLTSSFHLSHSLKGSLNGLNVESQPFINERQFIFEGGLASLAIELVVFPNLPQHLRRWRREEVTPDVPENVTHC